MSEQKTMDGATVVPEMTLYYIYRLNGREWVSVAQPDTPSSVCYSTRAVAESEMQYVNRRQVGHRRNGAMKCEATVWQSTWHCHQCHNKAKWLVLNSPRCGIHARLNDYFVGQYGRVPIEPSKEGATK